MTGKHDVKRDLDHYRAPRGRFRVVEVPEQRYLMVDGHGDPNAAPEFREAVEALQPVSWTLKFASRAAGHDYVVPPLEGLWWADDATLFTSARDKSTWDWTLLMLVPDGVDAALVGTAVAQVRAKGAPARLDDVRLETLAEGLVVQALHVGSFDDEAALVARMHEELLPAQGLRPTGRHHEIYLSDFRKVTPDRQRTIVRQPVVRIGP